MKMFISWSGPRSHAMAGAINEWLPMMIQAVRPFFSPDIEKGVKWGGEIDAALEGTDFGIFCLTPENLNSTWIHYEAGALSKTTEARIWTLLLGMTPSDVPQPLGRFQHTVIEKGDFRKMLVAINQRVGEGGGEAVPSDRLDKACDAFWPKLQEGLAAAAAIAVPERGAATHKTDDVRDIDSKLDEVLELLRSQQRRLNASMPERPPVSGLARAHGGPAVAQPIRSLLVSELSVQLPQGSVAHFLGKFHGSLPIQSWWVDDHDGNGDSRLVINLVTPATQELVQEAVDIAAGFANVPGPLSWSHPPFVLSKMRAAHARELDRGEGSFTLST